MSETECQVIVPLITPLTSNEEIDEKSLRKCVSRLVSAGIKHIFLLGSCGEYIAFDRIDRKKIISIVTDEVGDSAEIVTGVIGLSDKTIRRNMADCKAFQVSAYVLPPPFYFPLSQEDIFQFYCRITADSDKPILIYNIPQMPILPKTLSHIVEENYVIIGIKDSTSDMMNVQESIRLCKLVRPEIKFYQGTEDLIIPSLLAGANGVVPGLANVDPWLFLSLDSGIHKKNFLEVASLQEKILEISRLYKMHGSPVAGIKRALQLLDVIDSDLVSSPLRNLPESDSDAVKQVIAPLFRKRER